MNGASFGTVINNNFNIIRGNVLGMYNIDNVTIDGNPFTDCWQPISIQEPTNADHSLGRNIAITRNIVLGTQRAAIEAGPSSSGAEYFSNLMVTDNFFDNFDNRGGAGTLLPIPRRPGSGEHDRRLQLHLAGARERRGRRGRRRNVRHRRGVDSTIANFAFAALTYQSGWSVHDNAVYNDGSSPYYGFTNDGHGSGHLGSETTLSAPSTPGQPLRISW
jgi:hypothetical protein